MLYLNIHIYIIGTWIKIEPQKKMVNTCEAPRHEILSSLSNLKILDPSPWHLSGHGPAATGDEVQTGAVAAVELGGGLQVAETWWAPKIHATEKNRG
jgi:hypothetical protein